MCHGRLLVYYLYSLECTGAAYRYKTLSGANQAVVLYPRSAFNGVT
jgi:hypothetical protein